MAALHYFTRFKLNNLLIYSASTAIACVTTFQIVYKRQRHRVLAESPTPKQLEQKLSFLNENSLLNQKSGVFYNEVAVDDLSDRYVDNDKRNQKLDLMLENVLNWSPILYIRLMQNYSLKKDVAVHLANSYGGEAFRVASLATVSGKRWPVVGRRLHPEHSYMEAELRYALRKNVFCSAVDFYSRQTPLSQLSVISKLEILPRVVEIMAKELGWNKERQKEELKNAKFYLSM